ncbi:MAG: hypothetical protein AAFR27_02840 [Pseudomonadota bacterium]
MNAIYPSHLAMFAELDRLHYRRIGGGEALEAVGALRQKAYDARDIYQVKFDQPVIEEADYSDGYYLVGLYAGDTMVATVRLGVLDSKNPDTPAAKMFPSTLRPLVDQGQNFIDPSRMAVDPEFAGQFPSLPIFLLRTAVLATGHFQANQCLSVIKKEHEGFYRRVFRSTRLAGPIQPEGHLVDVVLLGSAIENGPRIFDRYPVLNFNRFEREALFADLPEGRTLSDPVIPSAAEKIGLDVSTIEKEIASRVA